MNSKLPYYFDSICRQEVDDILKGRDTGTFLVRLAKQGYVLSVSFHGSVIHYVLTYDAVTHLYHIANDPSTAFSSISDLCKHHAKNIGKLKTKLTLPATPSNIENISSDSPKSVYKNLPSLSSSRIYSLPPTMDKTQPSREESNSYLIPISSTRGHSSLQGTQHVTDNSNDHTDHEWFHGDISEDESFNRLSKMYKKHRLNGIYLVRSSRYGYPVLELINNKKKIKYEIHINNSNEYYISKEGGIFFTLKELIDFLRNNKPCTTGLMCELKCPCLIPNKKEGNLNIPNAPPSVSYGVKRKYIKLKEILGSGEFGEVKKASWKNGSKKTICAVKVLKFEGGGKTSDLEELKKERDIMLGLENANIVKLLGFCQDKDGLLLLLEYMPGGSLKEYIHQVPLSETKQKNIILQICSGMMYLSKIPIVHRDLAARNILLDESKATAKIADFGMSRLATQGHYCQVNLKKGPLKWYAPESLDDSTYSVKSDVWSFGVTMWEIFSHGEDPYNNRDCGSISHFLKGGGRLSQPKTCSDHFYSIMKSCWRFEPSDRPTFVNIYELL